LGNDETEAIDFDRGYRRVAVRRLGTESLGATNLTACGAEPDYAARTAAALCAPTYRDWSTTFALPPLYRLVRIAAPAERHGALSANALLVGAGLGTDVIAGFIPAISLRWANCGK
jgi:hypothetical protein